MTLTLYELRRQFDENDYHLSEALRRVLHRLNQVSELSARRAIRDGSKAVDETAAQYDTVFEQEGVARLSVAASASNASLLVGQRTLLRAMAGLTRQVASQASSDQDVLAVIDHLLDQYCDEEEYGVRGDLEERDFQVLAKQIALYRARWQPTRTAPNVTLRPDDNLPRGQELERRAIFATFLLSTGLVAEAVRERAHRDLNKVNRVRSADDALDLDEAIAGGLMPRPAPLVWQPASSYMEPFLVSGVAGPPAPADSQDRPRFVSRLGNHDDLDNPDQCGEYEIYVKAAELRRSQQNHGVLTLPIGIEVIHRLPEHMSKLEKDPFVVAAHALTLPLDHPVREAVESVVNDSHMLTSEPQITQGAEQLLARESGPQSPGGGLFPNGAA